jgi:hypothetical protein
MYALAMHEGVDRKALDGALEQLREEHVSRGDAGSGSVR